MIAFAIYLFILCVLIYKTSLFGIFKDNILNTRFFLSAFLIKVLGILVFYSVYTKLYGSIHYLDSGNFFRDSKAINDIAHANFSEFVKLMFGLQDDGEGSYIFENFLQGTTTWEKEPAEILYNDNRIILRLHALIHFISFGNYFVHALFSCLLSFIGINWIYQAFKNFFKSKEIYFFLIWVLFPGIWFWTAGLLKEGPALFLMGLLLISAKRILLDKNYSIKNAALLLVSVIMCILFKQYLMVPLCIITLVFFVVFSRTNKSIGLKFGIFLTAFVLICNLAMSALFQKDIVKVLSQRQRDFLDISNGGIFLVNAEKFVRVPYDFDAVKIDSSQKEIKASITEGVSYWYCEHAHILDTVFVSNNTDTATIYNLSYVIPRSYSTIPPPILNGAWLSFLKAIPFALYITTCKPLFIDARNAMDLVSSFENLVILLSLLWFIYNGFKGGFKNPWYIYFLCFALMILILIGITSPNIGAIQRYRALVIPFIMLTALLSSTITDADKLSNFFKNKAGV